MRTSTRSRRRVAATTCRRRQRCWRPSASSRKRWRVRPLELSLQGFRSYRGGAVFDFQDRGLFGIVGPTGAGKSSILDGLIFALYGRTPQIGKDTKKLITSGEPSARVRLVFDVDGAVWEVTRVLRDQGASQVV